MIEILKTISLAVSPILGLSSVLIAFKIMRINTTHSVRIRRIESGFTENRRGRHWRLYLEIQCLGLPLQNPQFYLVAKNVNGFGTMASAFQPMDSEYLNEYELTRMERGDIIFAAITQPYGSKPDNFVQRGLWTDLKNLKKRRVRVEVRCHGVTVDTLKPSFLDPLRILWNALAYRVDEWTRYQFPHPKSGEPCTSSYICLPRFNTIFTMSVRDYAQIMQSLMKEGKASEGG